MTETSEPQEPTSAPESQPPPEWPQEPAPEPVEAPQPLVGSAGTPEEGAQESLKEDRAQQAQAEEAAAQRDPAEPPPAYGLTADPPPGIPVGGQDRQSTPPDLAADPEPAGGDLGPLTYGKHSTEATNEDGEKVPIVVAHPVFVDGTNRRSDADGLEGQKVEIVDGDHKGRKGVFLKTETYDPQSGYPVQIIVRTDADDKYELLSVPYASVRPPQSVR